MLPGAGGYRVTRVTDKELLTQSQNFAMMHSICAMQENQHKCVEEIRFDAYAKAGEPSPQGASPGAFGQPATSATPFGASPSAGFGANVGTGGVGFGSTALNPSLGGPTGGPFAPVAAASPFGATGSAFGASAGSASPFGVTAPSAAGPFGSSQAGAFGGAGSTLGGGGVFGASSTPSGNAFGASPGASAFGSAPAPAFGSTTPGAGGSPFGTSPTAPAFGGAAAATSTNLFGASIGSAFGAAASAPGFGGAASAPSFGASAGAFGMPPSTPAFGGSTLGGSAFGAPASSSAFGAAQSSPAFGGSSAFGAPAGSTGFGAGPAGTAFGAAASSSAFGVNTSTPAINLSPLSGSTNLFGASAPTGGAFGASSPSTGGAPPFGASQASNGLFGAAASAPQASSGFGAAATTSSFGGFASTPASPGLFGTAGAPATGAALSLAPPAASTPSFSFSAASAPATGGIFSTGARPTGTPAFGAALPSTTLIGGGSALPSSPAQTLFGAAPSFSSPLGGAVSSSGAFTPGAGIHASSPAPTGIAILASPSVNAAPYGNSLAVPPPVISPVSTAKQSHKKSLLWSTSPTAAHVAFPVRSLTPRSPWLTTRGGLTSRMKPRGYSVSPSPHGSDFVSGTVVDAPTGTSGSTPPKLQVADNWMFKPRENPRSLFIRKPPAISPPTSTLLAVNPVSGALSQATESDTVIARVGIGKHNETPERRHVHFEDENVADDPAAVQNSLDVSNKSGEKTALKVNKNEIPVISAQDGYSIEPSPDMLRMLLEEKGEKALAQIEDFVVTRKNFGSVRWLEPVDIRGLEIDRVVRIERGVIYVYHEDSGVPSPPPGEGLKKRAEVTLYECRPKKEGDAARAKFEDRILKQTRRMGGELQEYDINTGVWRFTLQL